MTATDRPTRLRLVPPPDTDPAPCDPSRTAPAVVALAHRSDRARDADVQGTLALQFVLPNGTPARPTPKRALSLVSSRRRQDDEDAEEEPQIPVETPREELPDPHRWAAQLVQAAIETTHGDRPIAQLLRWTSREVYERLQRDAAPTSAIPAVARRRMVRPVIRSLHLTEPENGVVEACAVVHDGRRGRAVALRMEGLDGRWLCTALDLV
jgi:hypothetical protein